MTSWAQTWLCGFTVHKYVMTIAISMGLLGCSKQENTVSPTSLPSSPTPKQPKLSLAVQSPADRANLKPGSPLHILCTVIVESGDFEPMIVTFSLRDSKDKGKSKAIFSAQTINEKTHNDNSYTFLYSTKAPDKPGRYMIDAKITGVDASVPATGPPPAPTADGTPPQTWCPRRNLMPPVLKSR